MRYAWKLMVLCACLLIGSLAFGQRDGVPTFSAADAYEYDTVDLVSLVPTINIPATSSRPGALPFALTLTAKQNCCAVNSFYFNEYTPSLFGYIGYTHSTKVCGGSLVNVITNLTFYGSDSLDAHPLDPTLYLTPGLPNCVSNITNAITMDGSGFTVSLDLNGNGTVTSKGGTSVSISAFHTTSQNGTISETDVFGNQITAQSNGGVPYATSFTDTLGATVSVLSPSGSGFQPYVQWTDTTGHTQQISALMPSSYTVCSNNGSVTPITEYKYPSGANFTMTLETSGSGITGRIQSFTLPAGGQITYTYPGSGCATPPAYPFTFSRATADGTTQYSASKSFSSDHTHSFITTTVLDPGLNKEVYYFANFLYLVGKDTFQNTGTVASPTYKLISSDRICYNGNQTNCLTTSVSVVNDVVVRITQRDTYRYTYKSDSTQVQMSHDVQTYDSYGNLLTDVNTDSITGQVVATNYAYGTLSSGNCVALGNTNIHDHPCSIDVHDSSLTGALIGQTWFTYNSNGAVTSKGVWTGNGSSHTGLVTNYSPNSNGTEASMTAPNGQVTNYTYGNCNSLLLTDATTTVNGVVIDNKTTWDCNGAVVVDTTDPNGNEDDTTYDSMFRISTYTDRNENTTNYYYNNSPMRSAVNDPMNVYTRTVFDGLGRPTLVQKDQTNGGTTYDTVSTTYGWNGTNFQVQTSVPCATTADSTCPTVAMTELSNPVFGPVSNTDANSGTVTYARNANDASVTAGPAPSGENTKVVQTEVDGFGRVKSGCFLEASGGTSCGQVMGNSGILTSTTYAVGLWPTITAVTATRGSQTHTVDKDAIGRVTSFTTPEAGTVTNYYDSDSYCNISYTGSLNRTLRNGGKSICYYYDGLGRVLDIWTTYSVTGDYCTHFRYDSTANAYLGTVPTGVTVNNGKGRVIEAITDTYTSGSCPVPPYTSPAPSQAKIITDEWFSYDNNGHVTDMWQSSPNSGGYYHTTATYDADGTVTGLSGFPNTTYSFTWGVDGEDRPNAMSISGTTIVSATAGNGFLRDAAGRPTNVPVGASGDQDTYTYDNMGNMTEYTFSVNGTTDDGKLTWNPIGSLQKLVITDGFNAGGSQTCTFGTASPVVAGYDDVGRLLDDNCGSSLWHQSYSYDQYDNLTKTGNPGTSWNPGYSSTNNEMTGSSYNNDGQLTYDGVNSYSWNVYGQMVGTISGNNTVSCGTSGSSCATYDAYGRIIESSIGNSYQEMLYSPIGMVGYAGGQNTAGFYVPAPGGGDFFMSGGTMYFMHPDWLGTKRLGTSLSGRSYFADVAYSPYGDPYDSFSTHWYYTDFTGLTNEWASGIYTTPNRQLTANSSRWPSPDPAGASWNAYSYVTDPNIETDPSGLDAATKPAATCWLCRLFDKIFSPPKNPTGVDLAAGAAGNVLWWVMMQGPDAWTQMPDNPACRMACAAASKRPKDQWSKLWQYRRDAHKGFWGDHWLELMQNIVGSPAGEYSAAEQRAANKAINAFFEGKGPIERLVRDDKVLRGAVQEIIDSGSMGVRGAEFQIDLQSWDAIKEAGGDSLATKYKVGTWYGITDVNKVGFLPNGERATPWKLLDFLGKPRPGVE